MIYKLYIKQIKAQNGQGNGNKGGEGDFQTITGIASSIFTKHKIRNRNY